MEIIKERDAALLGYNECRATIEDARIALKAHAHEGLLLAALRIQEELVSERALADRLAEGLRKMVLYSEALILRIQDRSDINFKTLNEGIDLFNEWKEARND